MHLKFFYQHTLQRSLTTPNWCAHRERRSCPWSSAGKKCDRFSLKSDCFAIGLVSPRSMPAACACRKALTSKSATWTVPANSFTSIVARGARIVTSPWLPAKHFKFLVPVKALGKIFRAKFRDALKKTSLDLQLPPQIWNQDWVVDCEPVGSGQATLKYLAPYVFRVALSNHRILKLQDGQVTFRYQDGQTKMPKRATLPASEFIRRFLQHVLPHRFQKVRCFGFFRSQRRQQLQHIKASLAVPTTANDSLPQPLPTDDTPNQPGPKVIRCPQCARPMQLVEQLPRQKLTPVAPRSIRPP